MNPITIADFKKSDLRIAKILEVEEIAGADRIWKLQVDVGNEKKQIVAGIKSHYAREALLGKLVVIVNNLTPSMIRGVESQGMLLAAKDDKGLSVLVLDHELPPGSLVS